MRVLRQTVFSIALLPLFAACATAPPEPPAGAMKVYAEIPAVGTKWVTKRTDHQTGGATGRTWTIVEVSYPGRAVYGTSDGTETAVYDKATRNWIATLRGGNERFAASPDDGTFSWPLWVGKSWMASYTYDDRERGRSFSPVQAWWTVAAYENVTVPAGTFKAFRLESAPGTNNATRIVFWYAPDLKLTVKHVFERTSDHYLGYGKFTTELVEFPAK